VCEVGLDDVKKEQKRRDYMDQTNHVVKGLGVEVMDMALCRLFVLFCKWLFCFVCFVLKVLKCESALRRGRLLYFTYLLLQMLLC
jgi:hypothetical protein